MPKKHPSHKSHQLGRWIHIKPRARSGIQMLRVSSGFAGWIILWDKRVRVLALQMPSVSCGSQPGLWNELREENFRSLCGNIGSVYV